MYMYIYRKVSIVTSVVVMMMSLLVAHLDSTSLSMHHVHVMLSVCEMRLSKKHLIYCNAIIRLVHYTKVIRQDIDQGAYSLVHGQA